jgi:hypothetical protein
MHSTHKFRDGKDHDGSRRKVSECLARADDEREMGREVK